MIRDILFFLIFFVSISSYSQQFSSENVLTSGTQGIRTVKVGDINGDGLLDIVSSNQWSNQLAWYRNLDDGNFSELITIAPLNQPIAVGVGDIDNDGDLDIIGAEPTIPTIVWIENLDGQGDFGEPTILSTSSSVTTFILPIDLNDDGHLDFITCSDGGGIEWFKNNGDGQSFESNILIDNALGRAIAAGDLDNDGDLDLVSGTTGGDFLFWFENLDGNGTMSGRNVIENQGTFHTTFAIGDINDDGKQDVVVGVDAASEISWYENLDNAGNFSSKKIISDDNYGVINIHLADLDNDNDLDILSAEFGDDRIVWIENLNGEGTFGDVNIINDTADSARFVVAGDLDNDGDLDVVSGSRNDSKVAWYENFEILNVGSNQLLGVGVYPNPTKGLITITTPSNIVINKATLYDINGKKIEVISKAVIDQIALTSLSPGLYFLTLKAQQGSITKRLIFK